MEYTRKQQEFMTAIEMGRNVYLHGDAGTGKSFITNQAQKWFKDNKKKWVSLAPTGIAANNVNGETLHSMFRIDPFKIIQGPDDCQFINKTKLQVLKKAEYFFVDEVSMCRPDIIDCMDWTLTKNGVKGGLKSKKIVFAGDLCQLPPIMTDNERSILLRRYDGYTFLDAEITPELSLVEIELDEIRRQSDIEFIEALKVVRHGGKSDYFRKFIHTEANGIILAAYNTTVKDYNEKGLKDQSGELITFNAVIRGTAKPADFGLEAEINVKSGCKVMYLVNSKDNPLRNGTLGIYIRKDGKDYFRYNNTDFHIEPVMQQKKEYVYDKSIDDFVLEERGSITQMPIKLAYALSIHKAQGLTLDEVTVDLRRRPFQKQQYYVAFSRVRTPEGLRIII